MSTPLRYDRAPIIEALIDIQVAPLVGMDPDLFARVGSSIESNYPTKIELIHLNTQLTFQPDSQIESQAQRNIAGYMWINRDQRNNVQVRLNGFTFRRLAPYNQWEVFAPEARTLWAIFRSFVPDCTVTRLAVKYTNRFDVPLPIRDFRDYLRTYPEISSDLPQKVQQLLLQFATPLEDIGATALVTETIVPPVSPNTCAIVLDIDIFQDQEVPQDEQGIWDYFDQLRRWKNVIFNQCTTERMKELIR